MVKPALCVFGQDQLATMTATSDGPPGHRHRLLSRFGCDIHRSDFKFACRRFTNALKVNHEQ